MVAGDVKFSRRLTLIFILSSIDVNVSSEFTESASLLFIAFRAIVQGSIGFLSASVRTLGSGTRHWNNSFGDVDVQVVK